MLSSSLWAFELLSFWVFLSWIIIWSFIWKVMKKKSLQNVNAKYAIENSIPSKHCMAIWGLILIDHGRVSNHQSPSPPPPLHLPLRLCPLGLLLPKGAVRALAVSLLPPPPLPRDLPLQKPKLNSNLFILIPMWWRIKERWRKWRK